MTAQASTVGTLDGRPVAVGPVGPTPTPLTPSVAPHLVQTFTAQELLGQIISIKQTMVSGVESAAYGDKRTEFRSLSELREILAALEEELDDLLGTGGRVRQIRMTTQWDKGL